MDWMLYTLFYGVIKGAREIVKKKALGKSTVFEVLFFYTLFGFLFLLPTIPTVGGMTGIKYLLTALKAFCIFIAWICSFKAIEKIPVSVYGVLDLSRVLFATLLGVAVLHEVMKWTQVAGLMIVAAGLMLLKAGSKKRNENTSPLYVVMALISCVLNAVSGLMDKILTNDGSAIGMTSSQLQFWYMFFLTVFYALYFVLSRTKADVKGALKNHWIWILSIMFILADRALFMANEIPDSRVTVMTLIKQSGCIVTILGGRFVFKEKNTLHKLICAGIVIVGIVIGVI